MYFPLESARYLGLSSSLGSSLPAITAESGFHQPFNALSAFGAFGSAHNPTDVTETTINAATILTSYSRRKVNDLGVPTHRNPACKHKPDAQKSPGASETAFTA